MSKTRLDRVLEDLMCDQLIDLISNMPLGAFKLVVRGSMARHDRLMQESLEGKHPYGVTTLEDMILLNMDQWENSANGPAPDSLTAILKRRA